MDFTCSSCGFFLHYFTRFIYFYVENVSCDHTFFTCLLEFTSIVSGHNMGKCTEYVHFLFKLYLQPATWKHWYYNQAYIWAYLVCERGYLSAHFKPIPRSILIYPLYRPWSLVLKWTKIDLIGLYVTHLHKRTHNMVGWKIYYLQFFLKKFHVISI